MQKFSDFQLLLLQISNRRSGRGAISSPIWCCVHRSLTSSQTRRDHYQQRRKKFTRKKRSPLSTKKHSWQKRMTIKHKEITTNFNQSLTINNTCLKKTGWQLGQGMRMINFSRRVKRWKSYHYLLIQQYHYHQEEGKIISPRLKRDGNLCPVGATHISKTSSCKQRTPFLCYISVRQNFAGILTLLVPKNFVFLFLFLSYLKISGKLAKINNSSVLLWVHCA